MTATHSVKSAGKPYDISLDNDDFVRLMIIITLLPIVGFILGIIYLAKDEKATKRLGEVLLISSVGFVLLWSCVLGFVVYRHDHKSLVQIQQSTGATSTSDNSTLASAEDSLRESTLSLVQTDLDSYQMKTGSYPTLAQLNSKTWTQANLSNYETARDPEASSKASEFASAPKAKAYSYSVTPSGCANTDASKCTGYTLTTILSTGKPYEVVPAY